MESNDQIVMKATLLRKINSKIKTEEQSSIIKPLLTCRFPLTRKNLRENTQNLQFASSFVILLCKPREWYKCVIQAYRCQPNYVMHFLYSLQVQLFINQDVGIVFLLSRCGSHISCCYIYIYIYTHTHTHIYIYIYIILLHAILVPCQFK